MKIFLFSLATVTVPKYCLGWRRITLDWWYSRPEPRKLPKVLRCVAFLITIELHVGVCCVKVFLFHYLPFVCSSIVFDATFSCVWSFSFLAGRNVSLMFCRWFIFFWRDPLCRYCLEAGACQQNEKQRWLNVLGVTSDTMLFGYVNTMLNNVFHFVPLPMGWIAN